MSKIRVLVIDDSALARDLVITALSRADDIDIVGSAADPLLARRQIALLRPDVLTLDVEMPRMDGLAFLEQLMRLHPLPVVMVSSLTSHDSATSLRALLLGAVDVVGKPSAMGAAFEGLAAELIAKVRLAGQAQIRPPYTMPSRPAPAVAADMILPPNSNHRICALVGGLGSVATLIESAAQWPATAPPLLIAFTESSLSAPRMAEYIAQKTRQPIHIAHHGHPLRAGEITLLTPDHPATIGHHGRETSAPYLLQAPLVGRGPQPFFADALLCSLAVQVGEHASAALLSSANHDGAQGLSALLAAKGQGFLQDRLSAMFSTCTQEAQRLCDHAPVVPLTHIMSRLITSHQGQKTRENSG